MKHADGTIVAKFVLIGETRPAYFATSFPQPDRRFGLAILARSASEAHTGTPAERNPYTRILAVNLSYGGKSPAILPLPAVSNARPRRSS